MRRGLAVALATIVALAAAGSRAAVALPQRPAVPPPGRIRSAVPGSENPHGPAAFGPRDVAGRVERITRHGAVGASGLMVTLHRVGPDRQGPVDSVRSSAAGAYRFHYRASGSDRAIYFVSASWAGIAYFTRPLTGAHVAGDLALITLYDTASAALPLHLRGRHLIVSAADSSDAGASRSVIEVFELANDSMRTLVGRDSTAPTWTAVLPGDARGAAMGPGEVSADAAAFEAGRLRIYAPFAPGIKQFSFSYTLPQRAFPLAIPAGEVITVLEVLIEDPGGTAEGGNLQEVNPFVNEGRTYRRFLAQDVPADAVVTIGAPGSRGAARVVAVYGIALGVALALLAGLGVALWRRRGGRQSSALHDDDPDRLMHSLARHAGDA